MPRDETGSDTALDLEAAAKWVDARLTAHDALRTGPVMLERSRPWADIASAPTTLGKVWLKAPGPGTAFEVQVYGLLSQVDPGAILEPLGIDEDRGWILLPDGGPKLGDLAEGPALVEGMIAGLRRYGELQRRLDGQDERLLELGLADMRPAAMPERFEEALAASRRYADDQGGAEDLATIERIEAHRGQLHRWAAELAERPGGATLDHTDLHQNNVFGDPAKPDTLRFYDWGDSVVAHPFAASGLPLGIIERRDPGSLARARDAYLELFADLAPHGELVETLELACRCAKVARALSWERAVRGGGPDVPESFARAPLATLASLLDDSYATLNS